MRPHIKSGRPIFKKFNGVGWFPIPIVWRYSSEFLRVLLNECVHCFKQQPEVFLLASPFLIWIQYSLDYPVWWIAPALVVSYWIVYGLLAAVTKLQGNDAYLDHPMEKDSRQCDDENYAQRPPFNWLRIFFQSLTKRN